MRKNKIKKLVISIGIFLLIAIIVGCIIHKTKYKRNKEKIIIKDNVSVITIETKKDNQPIKVTDKELIFKKNQQYTKGDVIVAGIIDSAPTGFIRKVVKTTKKDNKYIVKTEYGVLTDVFEEAHISKSFALSEDAVKEVDFNNIEQVSMVGGIKNKTIGAVISTPTLLLGNNTDYKFSKEFECDLTRGISAKGKVKYNIWLDIEIDISHGDVVFGVVAHNKSDGTICIDSSSNSKIDIEFEKDLFDKKLPNFQFNIARIPIVITNEIQSCIKGKANIEGLIENSFKIKSKNSSGFQYNSKTNKVREIKEKKYLSDGLQCNTEKKFSGGNSAGVFLHLISKLYGSTGADIAVGIEGETEGKISVSPKKKHDGLNYVGSVDLSISPKLQGSIVVSIPVIDRTIAEMQIFEKKLDPFWKKHWDSGDNWKKELQSLEPIKLNNTYQTRFGKVYAVTCPQFKFYYSDNWKVIKEEISDQVFSEKDVISNNRGISITYMDFGRVNGLGNTGRFMYQVKFSKVADSSFVPTVPDGVGMDGTDQEFSHLGNFIVAKIKIVGDLYMDKDSKFTATDGDVLYAVVPESYIGMHEVVGMSGLYDECSFNYPAPYAFIAEADDGKFTKEEEKEVIEILSSFRTK